MHLSVSSSFKSAALPDLHPSDQGERKSRGKKERTINKALHNGGKKWPTRHPIRREMRRRRGESHEGKIPRCTQISLRPAARPTMYYSRAYILPVSQSEVAKELRVQTCVPRITLKVPTLQVGIVQARYRRSLTSERHLWFSGETLRRQALRWDVCLERASLPLKITSWYFRQTRCFFFFFQTWVVFLQSSRVPEWSGGREAE